MSFVTDSDMVTLYKRPSPLGLGHLFACESKQIQFPVLHTSPVDIVRHMSTQNQSDLSSFISMIIYLSSALGMTQERMSDRLIYQQVI